MTQAGTRHSHDPHLHSCPSPPSQVRSRRSVPASRAQPGPSRDPATAALIPNPDARLKLPRLSEHAVLPLRVGSDGAWSPRGLESMRTWTTCSHKDLCNCAREPSEPPGRNTQITGELCIWLKPIVSHGTAHHLRNVISKWRYGHSMRWSPPLSSEASVVL